MAAKSLRCAQCGTLFRRVSEAQTHSEVTSHTQFEESEEVVKLMVCTECGKPCRTEAERGLHQRFTGHTEYKEQAADAPINTEVQMSEASAALKEEADLLKAAFGKGKSSGSSGSSGDDAKAADAPSTSGAEPEEMVIPEVDTALLKELEDMGFPQARSVRALHFSGATTTEGVVNWLVEHENDMDIDEPLLVPKSSIKPKLSPEEARAKAEELMRKAKEKREKEEKEAERRREQERIRAGKELQKAAEKEKEMAMKRAIEERQREKEEEARYRAALKAKMEEDRKERRRKLGLPEELTEEEKEREAERLKKIAEEEERKKKVLTHVKPVSVLSRLRDQMVALKKANAEGPEGERLKTACATMIKYIGNIATNPDEEKFRSIKLSNAAFQSRVACVPGTVDFLVTCGFEDNGEALVMPRDKVNTDVLNGAAGVCNEVLTNPFFGVL